MFEVRCSYEVVDKNWTKKDELIYHVAGKVSCWAGMGCDKKGRCVREHGWKVCTFDQALITKRDLEDIFDLAVSIKEE